MQPELKARESINSHTKLFIAMWFMYFIIVLLVWCKSRCMTDDQIRLTYDREIGVKGKIIPLLSMKAYREHGGMIVLFCTLGTRWRYVVCLKCQLLYHWEISLVPIKQVVGWASDSPSLFWRGEISRGCGRMQTMDSSADSLVTCEWQCYCRDRNLYFSG